MSHEAMLSGGWAGATASERPTVAQILPAMLDIPRREWGLARFGDAEGWDYLRACEMAPPRAFRLGAAQVTDELGFAAGAPLFQLSYRLDTPLQGGTLGRWCDRLARLAPRLLEWRLLAVGSPFTEVCPLGVHPRLPADAADAAVGRLVAGVEAEARLRGASMIAFKDLSARDMERFGPVLRAAGYTAIESLPLAVLDLDGTCNEDEYLGRLSAATRKDIRRKLKKAGRVEVEWRSSIEGLEGEVAALYEATRAQSNVHYGDFEELPEGYFERISRNMGGRVAFACYRIDGTLAAFNMLFIESDRVIDKFLGMRYPLAREHDLYAVSWMENVRFCHRIGRRYLQTGQTAYASKLRYGSDLSPLTLMVKHRNPVLNALVRLGARWLSFPRWDPDLKAHAERQAVS
ncbi:acetyltransferase (GNAT) family protein [Azorhizobium sp. AG788]|uniref:GNAT family N-acetyltransferase n=1 Tax=Azorhizobium sp. AG788 TaxID=2183897 RepID=UPI0010DCF3C5|nr:GNAT family N-acetyltransferase [Azorhizobium sp. AG788]TDT94661.1 acetyltransferase (GNAT) family protein [Azorhizobium sp. AG788]